MSLKIKVFNQYALPTITFLYQTRSLKKDVDASGKNIQKLYLFIFHNRSIDHKIN